MESAILSFGKARELAAIDRYDLGLLLGRRDIPRLYIEAALLSEAVPAGDWNRPEEDEAWSHLQTWID